jgi:hypothetical protein
VGGRLLALPLAFALISATDPRTSNGDWPPDRFTRDTTIRVHFVTTQDELDALCGAASEGHTRAGCERSDLFGKMIVLPHPLGRAESASPAWFRRVVAHELAHANGWNATHDN